MSFLYEDGVSHVSLVFPRDVGHSADEITTLRDYCLPVDVCGFSVGGYFQLNDSRTPANVSINDP